MGEIKPSAKVMQARSRNVSTANGLNHKRKLGSNSWYQDNWTNRKAWKN